MFTTNLKMFCLPKCIVRAIAKSKTGHEPLLDKEVIPDFRILLLGKNNSGKTTFLKQALKKYGGFSDSECMEYKEEIIKIVYKIVAKLATEMRESKSHCEVDLQGDAIREIIKESESNISTDYIPNNHFETIKQFWRSAAVKKCYEICKDDANHEDYFLNNLGRIASDCYIPSAQDIMRVNISTNCITTRILKMNGLNFEVTDTPSLDSRVLSFIAHNKYDFVVYFVSLYEFRTVNTSIELQEISENISNIRTIVEGLINTSSLLLYFTQTQDYLLSQKYSQTRKNSDFIGIAKYRMMRNFSRFIESVPNKIYNYFEDTNKLTNMKLVYELMKHEAIIKNLKQIHCSS